MTVIKILNESGFEVSRYAEENIYEISVSVKHSKKYLEKGFNWNILDNCIVVGKNGLAFVGTGLFVDIESGYEIEIRQICHKLTKRGLIVCHDYINCNHSGEMYIIIQNILDEPLIISNGEVIAQICGHKTPTVDICFN